MSDVGKFFRKKCKQKNIPLVNIVRKEEHVEAIRKEGHLYCLNSEDPGFEKQLKDICSEIGATIAFECVAGQMTGRVFNKLPPKSSLHVFGSLSLKMISEINPTELIFNQKSIHGFHLVHSFLQNRNLKEFEAELNEDFKEGLIQSNYQSEISLEDINSSLVEYKSSFSKGKLLVKLN